MTEDEIEAVAGELAKAGGTSWYPGRVRGPLLKIVSDRYRQLAGLVIATLDHHRAQKAGDPSSDSVQASLQASHAEAGDALSSTIQPGATVVYRPPGEQRAYPCRVERVEGNRAYLVPHLRAWTGWVSTESPSVAPSKEDAVGGGTIMARPALQHPSTTGGKLDAAYASSIVAQENSPYSLQGGLSMTDDEVEVVAVELAKAGGLSWPSGQERGPLKLVMDRYRDRARLAIATLDRLRIAKHSPGEIKIERPGPDAEGHAEPMADDVVSAGSLVLYRPPGDKRTYPCRIEKVEGSRVYLVPELPTCTGWVDLANLSSSALQ